jgi:hypothetical protein
MRISANRMLQSHANCTVWIEYTDDGYPIAQVDSGGAILWATADQPCVGTAGNNGFGPRLQRQQNDDMVVYLPEDGT